MLSPLRVTNQRAASTERSLLVAFAAGLIASLSLLTGAGLTSGCVGSSENRRAEPASAYSGPVVSPDKALLTGRFQSAEDGAVSFEWSGSAATLHFSGTAVSAELTDSGDNRYLVLVDGKPLRDKVAPLPGRSTVELIKGLPRGEHTVTLYRLTEPLLGTSTLHGFILDTYGEPRPAPAPRKRRILLIGDSITAGYGNEATSPSQPFSADTENHFITYGARAGRELEADVVTLAWSGKGVASNRGDTQDPRTMNELWLKTLPAEGESAWSFDDAAPDAIVINLGTNDFSPEVQDTTPFAAAYEKLVADVRARYPKAHIALAVGPLLSDHYPKGKNALTTVRTVLEAVVSKRTEAGDTNIALITFAPPRTDEGLGADSHPSAKTHLRMAAHLTAYLKKNLAW